MKKIRLAIIYGGRSAEHEVSIVSAKNIIAAIDKRKYELIPIGIDQSGRWFLQKLPEKVKELGIEKKYGEIIPIFGSGGNFSVISGHRKKIRIDVAFPILHGPFGEDGTIQGILKSANVPFVGAGVLGSAVGMDKDVMKRLLRDSEIPIADFLVFEEGDKISFSSIVREIGIPFFVKPANLGSSVGISKVKKKAEFKKAICDAFLFDRKIIIEEAVNGREIECSVLGNKNPIASLPGEVIPHHDFYSYEAKYLDENGAGLEIPARLPKKIGKNIQKMAIDVFKSLSCEGFARVDFFLKDDGEVLVNEINTIPGFTSISMYPKLWEASGIKYQDLINRIIKLSIERFKEEEKLKVCR